VVNKQDKDTRIIEQVAKLMRKLNVSESYGIIASSENDNDIEITGEAVEVVRELKDKAIEGRLKLRLLKVDKDG
jgi:hypothetical protein